MFRWISKGTVRESADLNSEEYIYKHNYASEIIEYMIYNDKYTHGTGDGAGDKYGKGHGIPPTSGDESGRGYLFDYGNSYYCDGYSDCFGIGRGRRWEW